MAKRDPLRGNPFRESLPEVAPAARRRMALAQSLFDASKSVHALTRTRQPLLAVIDLLRADPERPKSIALPVLQRWVGARVAALSASERRIVAVALRAWTRGQAIERGRKRGSAKQEFLRQLGLQLAAILQVAQAVDDACDSGNVGVAFSRDGDGIQLRVFGCQCDSRLSRAVRACALWRRAMARPIGSTVSTADRTEPGVLAPDDRVGMAASRVLREQIERFARLGPGLVLPEDIETVHEMRVALRRLRAGLRLFRSSLREPTKRLETDIKTLDRPLGQVRDGDVFIRFLDRECAAAPEVHRLHIERLIAAQHHQRRRAYRKALEAFGQLASGEGLLASVVGDADDARPTKRGRRRVRTDAPPRIIQRLDRLRKYGRQLSGLTAKKQHALRIDCKNLRYTGEFYAPIYRKRLAAITEPMTRLQDTLGSIHDADIYELRILAFFDCRDGNMVDLAGVAARAYLLERLAVWRKEAFREADKVWGNVRKKRTLSRLNAMIRNPRRKSC
jgi:CHAD domain-containing protein